jgi:hypothetical protein
LSRDFPVDSSPNTARLRGARGIVIPKDFLIASFGQIRDRSVSQVLDFSTDAGTPTVPPGPF